MKKIINKAENYVEECVRGIIKAHKDQVQLLDNDFRILIRKNNLKKNKVGIVTAGGSGHLPLFLGYVGENMIDGCAIGNVFASPSASKMESLIRACDFGKGVLCLYGNYGGDVMNFNLAVDMVEFDGIKTEQIKANDDIASAPLDKIYTRRGVAGLVYAYKIAGAASNRGWDLEKVTQTTNEAIENIRTIGFALSPCIVPEVGMPTFKIENDEIEIGMGIHGEQGLEVRKMLTADEIAQLAYKRISEEIKLEANDKASIMINGLGATPLEEQYIIYNRLYDFFEDKGVEIIQPHIGEFVTSMEMAGVSITVFKLNDEHRELLEDIAKTPFYTNFNK